MTLKYWLFFNQSVKHRLSDTLHIALKNKCNYANWIEFSAVVMYCITGWKTIRITSE